MRARVGVRIGLGDRNVHGATTTNGPDLILVLPAEVNDTVAARLNRNRLEVGVVRLWWGGGGEGVCVWV